MNPEESEQHQGTPDTEVGFVVTEISMLEEETSGSLPGMRFPFLST